MRTCTYKSVLDGVLRMQGISPADASAESKLQLQEFIANRYREACEYYPFPECCDIEPRKFRPEWTAIGYASGTELYHDGAYWQANAATGGSDVPGVSTKWEALTVFNRYIAHAQPGETEIGTMLRAWDADPRKSEEAAELVWSEGAEGVRFPPGTPAEVWIEFRAVPPDFTFGEEWSASTVLAAGERVLFGAEVYRATAATTAGQSPATNAERFAVVPFLNIFSLAVKRGAFADTLTEERQLSAHLRFVQLFTDALDDQISILVKQQGQTGRYAVRR